MKKSFDPPKRDRWARLRFSVIGPLMASPPEPGRLRDALLILAALFMPFLNGVLARMPTRRSFPRKRWSLLAFCAVSPGNALGI